MDTKYIKELIDCIHQDNLSVYITSDDREVAYKITGVDISDGVMYFVVDRIDFDAYEVGE